MRSLSSNLFKPLQKFLVDQFGVPLPSKESLISSVLDSHGARTVK